MRLYIAFICFILLLVFCAFVREILGLEDILAYSFKIGYGLNHILNLLDSSFMHFVADV